MSYISCKDLTLGYEGEAVAEHVSFEVNKGDYLCIVGENGAGKTTLMKTLLNLTKPLSGTMEIGDGLLPYEIGYLPQQTVVQRDFPATVWEIVLSGTLSGSGMRPFYGKEQKSLQKKIWRRWIYGSRKTGATESFREVSSRECCLQERFPQQKSFFCLTSL